MVVQDAGAYQRLRNLAAKIDDLEFLRQSIEEIDAEGVPMREAIAALGKKK